MKSQPNTNSFIENAFKDYLVSQGISYSSLKYYLSDLNHFFGWFIFRLRSLGIYTDSAEECLPYISSKIGVDYLDFLTTNKNSVKTINRRLSTLRHLSRFLVENLYNEFDFMAGIQNITLSAASNLNSILAGFQKHLESQNASKNTIKNYLSDIRHFINWVASNYQSAITNN